MSSHGLLRTKAEVWRASMGVADTGEVSATYALDSITKCALVRRRGRTVRGVAGEELYVDAVAYLPPGTDVRPEGPGEAPDRLRVFEADGVPAGPREYLCVFVDRRPWHTSPVRVGLRLVL